MNRIDFRCAKIVASYDICMNTNMPKRIPAQQQAATAAKINAIRASARGISSEELAGLPCPTCTRAAHDPYRRIVAEKITEGCVDAHHHGRTCAGGSTDWHMRPEVAEMRRKELAHLESLGRPTRR